MKMAQNLKKYIKKHIINGYIYLEKYIKILNNLCKYRGSKLVLHLVFNLTMEWPPPRAFPYSYSSNDHPTLINSLKAIALLDLHFLSQAK